MNVLGDFHFLRPAWLLLLPISVWIWWQLCRLEDPLRGWRAVMEYKLLEAMTVGDSKRGRWSQTELLAMWLLATIAMAGPTWRPMPSPFADDPVPVMVVLAASESMNLSDWLPSRLERAQLKIADLAAERQGQPMGLIAYAGTPHLVLPPTRDTSIVASLAAEITPAIMPKSGNDLAAALSLAASTLQPSGGTILVVADTAESEAEQELKDFRTKNRLPVRWLAITGADAPERESIRTVAKAIGASVTLMTADSTDVRSLVRSIARAPGKVSVSDETTRWEEAGWWFVPILGLLTLAGFRRQSQSIEHRTRSVER